jgi:membrane protein DedA with SNARE-associated domain
MLSNLTEFIVQNLTSIIESYGYFAVFILMTAESALIPIPSEITMPFAGFLAGSGVLNFWLVVFVGALANLFGSLLAFWLGKYKGEEWTRDAIRKWGKWLLIREKDFDLAKKWFLNHGQWIAFGSRLLPVVRTFISLPAGISKMNVTKFALYTFMGSLLWSGFLAFIGLKLGENWQALEPFFRKFQFVIVIGFILLAIAYVYKHIKHK